MKSKSVVIWLKEINKSDASLVGGKAANLGELYSKFPIPNGFCITVAAFENFLVKNDIKTKISVLLKFIDVNNIKKIESISRKIKEIIIKSKMPKELEKTAVQNYKKINGFVAVRSSAVAEDLEEASFAGQQATFLNVNGNSDLIKSIKECWASFYTSRAIIYRERNKFSHEPKMAVVVQKMIDAKKSGVVFTVNPVTKNKNEIVIEAAFGLGESVVSGMVTPDNYIVDKKKLQVINETINEKGIAIIKEGGKNKKINLDSKKSMEKTLGNKELIELAKEAIKIEKYYKKPMDIEWAIDDKIYILQARPITAL